MEVSQLNPGFALQGSASQAKEKLSAESVHPLATQVKDVERFQQRAAEQQHQVQGTLEIRPEPGKLNFSQKELLKLAGEVQEKLKNANVDIKMKVDKEAERILVQIRDPQTGEVVRQIPPEVHLKVVQALKEIQSGLQMRGIEFDAKF